MHSKYSDLRDDKSGPDLEPIEGTISPSISGLGICPRSQVDEMSPRASPGGLCLDVLIPPEKPT